LLVTNPACRFTVTWPTDLPLYTYTYTYIYIYIYIHTCTHAYTINMLGYRRLSSRRKETKSISRVLRASDPVTRHCFLFDKQFAEITQVSSHSGTHNLALLLIVRSQAQPADDQFSDNGSVGILVSFLPLEKIIQ